MPPLKPKTMLTLRSKIPFQTTPHNTAIHRTLTATAQNNTFLTPRKTSSQSSSSHLLHPNTTSTTTAFRTPLAPKTTTPTSPNPFDTLLNSLTLALTSPSSQPSPSHPFSPSLPALHDLLRNYTSNPTHWAKYAHANPQKKYTRNLITEVPGIFNLLLLVWTPGMRSPVHDHAGSHCLMKVLSGRLSEVRWAMPESSTEELEGREGDREALKEIGRKEFKEGKVAYISDRLGLHEIINPSEGEYAVSLHLYTPPNAATYGCHIYDPTTGESKHVMQGSYDSVRGIVNSS
ncbi:related to cysteine dioxygenase [Rhynchosporium secalis]|uniref:Cysteine dioxygenase n=1 Tax=Rhynchosporium secalis TaxID=38038 RepID=A0A1E1MTR0_RHYSE|nr:related to cysteine dioxygenase [Rhynchosporium secalis]